MSHIGIALCDCRGTLFTPEGAERMVSELSLTGKPEVYFFHLNALCSDTGKDALTSKIKERTITKLVCVGCSPIRKQELLKEIASRSGLTPGAVHGINVKKRLLQRDASDEPTFHRTIQSIRKAIDALVEIPEFETKQVSLCQQVLVIGGGVAGISAAQEIHRLGYPVTVVESAEEIGGRFFARQGQPKQHSTPPTITLSGAVTETMEDFHIFTKSALIELTGYMGNFSAKIRTPEGEQAISCGAIVVASGICVPTEVSTSAHIFSIAEIDLAIADLVKRHGVRTIGLILDQDQDETKAGMEVVFLLAKKIQALKRYQVALFCRDVRVAAKHLERLYDEVREAGVNIVKYQEKLALQETEKGVIVTYTDSILRQQMTMYCDRIGINPFGISTIADPALGDMLKFSTDGYGQFQENNIHLFPEQTNRPGIFVVGACRGQYYAPQIMADVKATALAVHSLLAQQVLNVELSNATVDPDKCVLCLTCVRSCPYKAMQVNSEKKAAESIPEVCQKCGICAGECPAKAIELPVYTDRIVLSQIPI